MERQWEQAHKNYDAKPLKRCRRAAVTGIVYGKGLDAGKPFEFRVRFADTWGEDARWQVEVRSQRGRAAELDVSANAARVPRERGRTTS